MNVPYKNALITGASSGLGRGLSLWFAKKGVRVFAAARRAENLDSLRKEAEAAGGVLEPVMLDVADSARTREVVSKLDRDSGGLDLVVANAGVGIDTPGKRFGWEALEQMVRVNVLGAAATLTAALPHMVERKRGHLVGVASLASYRGMPRMAGYSGTKAFLRVFLESLRIDLKPLGIHVTTLSPGFVKSEMTAKNKFPMPFLLETEDAVGRMASAILRGDSEYAFPLPMAATMKLLEGLPNPIFDLAAKRLR